MGPVETFLKSRTVSQLSLTKGRVYEATSSMDLFDAFNILVEQRLQSVPVWDEKEGKYIGFLTVRDLMSFAVFATAENNAVKTLEDILKHGVNTLGLAHENVTVSYLAKRNPFKPVSADATLAEIVGILAGGMHRVPVVGDNGRCSNIVSQSLLNDYLFANLKEFGAFPDATVKELQIGTSPVLVCRENDSALDVFRKLERSGRSGIGVVNSSGRLTGVTSGSDLKLYLSNRESLNQPIVEFLKRIRQADLKTRSPTFTCRESDRISHVMGVLNATRAHRLFVVNEDHHPIKVISILDILRTAIKH